MENSRSQSISKLTALWALSECGLGGVLHALKIPVTGFVLGAFSIVILYFIARYSNQVWKDILKATLIVLLVKFTISPHTPVPAYIAVGFQGLMGALLFSTVGANRTGAMLLGFITMIESALQKILVMTLLFGESIWKAFDVYINSILKSWRILEGISNAYTIAGIYVLVYGIWGIFIGYKTIGIFNKVNNQASAVLTQYEQLSKSDITDTRVVKTDKNRQLIIQFAGILLFIVSAYLYSDNQNGIGYMLLRSISVILFFYFVLMPVLKWAVQKLLLKKRTQHQASLTEVIEEVNSLRKGIKPAYQLASVRSNWLKRFFYFIQIMITVALYGHNTSNKTISTNV